jgi:hypothetical protein
VDLNLRENVLGRLCQRCPELDISAEIPSNKPLDDLPASNSNVVAGTDGRQLGPKHIEQSIDDLRRVIADQQLE